MLYYDDCWNAHIWKYVHFKSWNSESKQSNQQQTKKQKKKFYINLYEKKKKYKKYWDTNWAEKCNSAMIGTFFFIIYIYFLDKFSWSYFWKVSDGTDGILKAVVT